MPKPSSPEIITLAVTGASGAVLAKEALQLLARDTRVRTVNLVVSEHALRVMGEELGISGRTDLVQRLLSGDSVEFAHKIQLQNNADIGANIASGSYPTDAMIVLPCSMGTLSKIANGLAEQLIERAADVCLKEDKPLVLCVREAPLNKIHLRNMSLAADAGATIFPVVPSFYHQPQDTAAMAREFVNRVLAHIGLPQPQAYRWTGSAK